MTTSDDVLQFWFDHGMDRWFRSDADFDREIRDTFGDAIARAKSGELDDWTDTAEGTLALVILLDQFTRNVFRGTADAFSGDARALRIARAAIERGADRELPLERRAFLYMPLEHSEEARAQDESIAAFERLLEDARGTKWESLAETFLDYAHRHKVIIDRFGRYPHRNEILGRETTAEEAEFLTQPNSSF